MKTKHPRLDMASPKPKPTMCQHFPTSYFTLNIHKSNTKFPCFMLSPSIFMLSLKAFTGNKSPWRYSKQGVYCETCAEYCNFFTNL